jgi:DNA invertase Pin-like site-specific DNA recombinase
MRNLGCDERHITVVGSREPPVEPAFNWRCAMSALLVGYARCSTDQQDLTAQRDALLGLGVVADRIYVDHGLTGTNRERPGLREALAACRAGDTLVVTKLDRLARSLPDARAIADELTARQISLSLGGSVYDPTDAVGRLLFNVLAMVAEFESDLIRLRTREGTGRIASCGSASTPKRACWRPSSPSSTAAKTWSFTPCQLASSHWELLP